MRRMSKARRESKLRWQREHRLKIKAQKGHPVVPPPPSALLITCHICSCATAVRDGKKYDVTDDGRWELHPHQPQPVVFAPYTSRDLKSMKLMARDFIS